MKLLLTNFHRSDGGGHTRYVVSLARALAARHEVHVAAPPGSRLLREAEAIAGVRTQGQPFPNGLRELFARSRALRRLAAYLRAHVFDVVHVNGSADHRLVLAALRGLPRRPRVVLTKHNSKPMRGLGHRWRARRTDAVIAVSEHTRRELQHSPYAHCRIATVLNGIDTDHYAPWPRDAALGERRRWAQDTMLLLGSNAGTAKYKGWMDLLEAMASLPPTVRTQVRVVLAGRLPDAHSLQRVEALGLKEQVHFIGLLDDVRPMLAAIDAGFVLSYDVETISFACREMMAMGKPVLVSDYAGLSENIDDGVDGWVVPARDRAAIAARVMQMLESRQNLAAMPARVHAERDFGLAGFVERTESVYVDMLSSEFRDASR